MVNVGEQNKPHAPPGRSILDYSLVACFTLIVLLAILVLDAFEYITVPGASQARGKLSSMSAAATTNEELAEVQKQIDEAKALLKEKHDEVDKLVTKVEAEIKKEETPVGATVKIETPAEQKVAEEKKEQVIAAIVEKELGIESFCSNCQYGAMGFTCGKRVSWMMDSYGITEDMAKESALNKCHYRRLRGGGRV
mmetsp:Transcript_24164/g.52118  ORF Transcript_24164/g.52118 Transcript_24164/m.52118 type:complete len:195 (-) Transcript_24164:339-923(-)|eukprot:CAMPEP_0172322434 /NCGR_PEP_ID=MMETSP1058-20130122/45861_1 /TAXON_ID=83371 /ORGANISM="Detonula confervacea, Strain CCMP 353" /LENGTH=194 /DNA_ID=CAMNT_0013038171 /DNA_START=114 /DNA_END=698 /DNA_ORIENTATION=+